MRAVRYHEYGDADVLRVEEIDRPPLGTDEVLVELRIASVNPVDAKIRRGEFGSAPLPAIPGSDGAGIVADVGDDVDVFAVGDRVFLGGVSHDDDGGTFAEYITVPETKVARLPEDVPFEVGGAIANVGATAWTALIDNGGLEPTDSCLIHGGSGGVGHAAVQIATAAGADVIATAGRDEARERLREFGASSVFDYDSDSLAGGVLAATDGEGVDVILDHRLDDYLELDLSVAAQGGRVVSILGDLAAVSGAPLRDKELTVRGMSMANVDDRRPILRRLARLLERGDLTASVARSYDIEEAVDAHRAVRDGGYVGKLVVRP